MGIKGNEKADEAAKSALLLPVDKNIKISYTDMRSAITAHFKGLFQSRWNDLQFNKIKSVKEHVGKTVLKGISFRSNETVLHRARIGHTRTTHRYLLNRQNVLDCTQCQCL